MGSYSNETKAQTIKLWAEKLQEMAGPLGYRQVLDIVNSVCYNKGTHHPPGIHEFYEPLRRAKLRKADEYERLPANTEVMSDELTAQCTQICMAILGKEMTAQEGERKIKQLLNLR